VVGVYGSGGAPWHHLAFCAVHGAEVRVVRAEDIEAGRLHGLDVLIVPGGGAAAMAGLLAPLGESGAAAVRRWVEGGGTYLSSCAGSVLPLALAGEADAALPLARCLRMVDVPLANTGDATLGGLSSPGVGRIEVRLDSQHPFARGMPERVELVHYNGPLFDLSALPGTVHPFAWPTGASEGFTPAERFLLAPGAEAPADEETTLLRCIASSAATGMEASVGRGRAVLFGSHPEFGLGPLCLGWGQGSRLLLAALLGEVSGRVRRIRVGGGKASASQAPGPAGRAGGTAVLGETWAVRRDRPGVEAPLLAAEAVLALRTAAARFVELAGREPSAWLDAGFAPSFHGRDARTAWREDSAFAARAAAAAADDLAQLVPELTADDLPWLDDEARPGQDFGAMGLTQLVRAVRDRLDRTDAALLHPPRRPAHAYDLFDDHPFHLAVGSYLSAAGLVAAALLTVAVLAARKSLPLPEIDRLLWADAADGAALQGETCS
jgi:hypothetical protein